MIIYKTTNLINGKIYIGKYEGKYNYYIGSGKIIKRAIEKYGKENFKFEVVDKASSIEELNIKEREWIAKLDTYKNGYNSSKGDKNMPMEELTKAKISAKLKGRKKPHFNKPVVEITTGKEFESQTEAFNYFGLGRNTVYNSIKTGAKTVDGLIFRFKEI